MISERLFSLKYFLVSLLASFMGLQSGYDGLKLAIETPTTNLSNAAKFGGGQYKKTLGEIILFVLILFIVFLFATSGIIANSNIQTQLKNGAYYGGLFASVVVILIVLA